MATYYHDIEVDGYDFIAKKDINDNGGNVRVDGDVIANTLKKEQALSSNSLSQINLESTGEITFWTRESGPLTERIKILKNGDVGIGTAADPSEKLEVNGTVKAAAFDGSLASSNISGQLTNGQIADLAASKITGTLSADKITGGTIIGDLQVTGKIGIGTPATGPEGKLDVRGDIMAGNSDIYFTKIDHNHTGIGNTSGYAAIENAADYDALMILGRAGTSKKRSVKLWDYLQVNGNIDITGNVGIGTSNPSAKLTIRGHGHIFYLGAGTYSDLLFSDDIGQILANALGKRIKVNGEMRTVIDVSDNFITLNPKPGYHTEYAKAEVIWEYLETEPFLRVEDHNGKNKFIIKSDGSVGIGTDPKAKLHVGGAFIIVDGLGNEQMYIGGDGMVNDVQIGSFNSEIMSVSFWNTTNGFMDIKVRDCQEFSDLRYKKNIQAIPDALSKAMKLHGVMYDDLNQSYSQNKDIVTAKKIGFIAQEVKEILPQVVSQDNKGYYAIRYTSIIPLLVEAMKEQQTVIEELKMKISEIERTQVGAC